MSAVTLAVGGAVVANTVISQHSLSWYVTTTFLKGRMLDFAISAAAALAIGVGLLPAIAGLAALAGRHSGPNRETRAFKVVSAAAIAAFCFYAAVKAAYLSTIFANLIVERNLIYLAPLLFVGTGLVLSRRDSPIWATLVGGAVVAYLVFAADYSLANFPNYEAHGLAVAAFANRIFRWPEATIQVVLLIVVAGSVVALLALRHLHGGRPPAFSRVRSERSSLPGRSRLRSTPPTESRSRPTARTGACRSLPTGSTAPSHRPAAPSSSASRSAMRIHSTSSSSGTAR